MRSRTKEARQSPRARWLMTLPAAVLLMGALAYAPDAPVADAAQDGDLDRVKELVRGGADVNAAQGDGMTALHWAAMNGDPALAEVLLYAGAHPESTTRLGGYTPLHLASHRGLEPVVRALLAGGSAPDTPTETGVQAVHLAAESGDAGTVRALIERGADVNVKDGYRGRTPLMFATAYGRMAVVDLLVESGADLTLETQVVDYVERSKVDSEERKKRAAVMAAQKGEDPEAAANAPLGPYGGQAAKPDTTNAEGADTTAAPEEADTTATTEPETEPHPEVKAEPDRPTAPVLPAAPIKPEELPVPDPDADPDAKTQPKPETDPEAKAEPKTDPDATEEPDPDSDEAKAKKKKEMARSDSSAVFPSALGYTDLVGKQGGFTALHYAARQGQTETALKLLDAGADVNQLTGGDHSSPLLVSIINGNYDLAMKFLERGADPNLLSEDGVGPVFAVMNSRWALRTWYPQPTAWQQQETNYLDLTRALLEAGADVNARVNTHIWYTAYNAGRMGVDFGGATPFWRAAYSLDVDAMRLLHEFGADPNIPSTKPAQRQRPGNDDDEEEEEDPSGLPEVEVGGPAVHPLHAASGVGYGTSRVGQQHKTVPDGWLPAVKFLVEEMKVDVNVRDHDGYSALHNAASRGDDEMIRYLIENGADVMVVSRKGQTTVDMANGPQQRVQPFPSTMELLMSHGAVNNDNCISC